METRKRKLASSTLPPSPSVDLKDHGSTAATGDDNDDGGGGGREKSRRRSRRGNESGIERLASRIVRGDNVVFVTGAGLSAASGIRPFRRGGGGDHHNASHQVSKQHSRRVWGDDSPPAGLWDSVVWTTATRECFRKDPLRWYNRFFLPHFFHTGPHYPNWGHRALDEMLEEFKNVRQVTQNIDGLQKPSSRLVEVHGRVGLYRCLNDEDDDSDSDESDQDEENDENDESDDDGRGMNRSSGADSNDRKRRSGQNAKSDESRQAAPGKLTSHPQSFRVRLGHRGKSRRYQETSRQCRYQYRQPLEVGELSPTELRCHLTAPQTRRRPQRQGRNPPPPPVPSGLSIDSVPRCPSCDGLVMPLALMFDEGYHSHSFYRFETVEEWIESASVLVF
jgi:NAD-dependent SIR2 family protein deacetylase